ncbi:MAG: hypothetical protein KIH65_004745 [Candidatus Uhrbacteria bacterium]|nr:hypothetical protein [Candidatus Uhrbacteria bacterium]
MNISMRSFVIAVISAVTIALLQPWILDNQWIAILAVTLVGFFFTVTQQETKARRFLVSLLVSSLVFSVLVAGISFFRELLRNTPHTALPIPFPLSPVDIGIIAGACLFLTFMGGLLGIAAKALYALYSKKLPTVIFILGPFVLTIASLGIAKVRIGGTVISAYHGWPYPYLTHQLKDALDGFMIDRWAFSPGSLWHNIFFNYAIYFLLLLAVHFGIQKINARTKKQHDFVLWSSALILILSLGFLSSLPIRKAFISHEMRKAIACETDTECTFISKIGPYGCGLAINAKDQSRIISLVNDFPWTYYNPTCVQENPRATCVEQRCQITIDQPNEYAWVRLKNAIKYCDVAAITQSHDRRIVAILKQGDVIKAIEPDLDDVFDLVQASGCPEIRMATE